jgi:DNA-directed RNA polymerase specialized sigma subunit
MTVFTDRDREISRCAYQEIADARGVSRQSVYRVHKRAVASLYRRLPGIRPANG